VRIRFDRPTVPLWVSEQYILRQAGQAVIQANRLNARLRPEIDAPVISGVVRGYQSPILESRTGFAQILMPVDMVVAVKADPANSLLNAASSPSTAVENQAVNLNQTDDRITKLETPFVAKVDPDLDKVEPGQSTPAKTRSREELLHLIAPGDAISLFVFGESDLSVDNVRVPASGRVSLPLIGSVSVAGKTTKEVEESVRDTLSGGYVKNPRVSVTIFSYRPIFIRGAVRSTGSFPYTEGLTIAKAIALAGGSKNSAKANGVSVSRDGETINADLALDSKYKVASGDVITIEEELGVSEDPTLFIYLHGEVASPGEYLFRRGLTVEKAVVLAGGFTLRGSPNKIKITRYVGLKENEEPIKLKGVKLYTPIEPGDVIKIGARWF